MQVTQTLFETKVFSIHKKITYFPYSEVYYFLSLHKQPAIAKVCKHLKCNSVLCSPGCASADSFRSGVDNCHTLRTESLNDWDHKGPLAIFWSSLPAQSRASHSRLCIIGLWASLSLGPSHPPRETCSTAWSSSRRQMQKSRKAIRSTATRRDRNAAPVWISNTHRWEPWKQKNLNKIHCSLTHCSRITPQLTVPVISKAGELLL